MALRRLLVNVANVKTSLPVLQTSTRAMGGGAAPTPAPFARMAKPTRPLTEEHELIWDDGVAPETCIDFDVPNYTRNEGRNWFFSGLGFFAVLAACLNCLAVGAPLLPGFLIFSPDPAFILLRLA